MKKFSIQGTEETLAKAKVEEILLEEEDQLYVITVINWDT
jgi:hypothetical protein